jgi:hypothetical protein
MENPPVLLIVPCVGRAEATPVICRNSGAVGRLRGLTGAWKAHYYATICYTHTDILDILFYSIYRSVVSFLFFSYLIFYSQPLYFVILASEHFTLLCKTRYRYVRILLKAGLVPKDTPAASGKFRLKLVYQIMHLHNIDDALESLYRGGKETLNTCICRETRVANSTFWFFIFISIFFFLFGCNTPRPPVIRSIKTTQQSSWLYCSLTSLQSDGKRERDPWFFIFRFNCFSLRWKIVIHPAVRQRGKETFGENSSWGKSHVCVWYI